VIDTALQLAHCANEPIRVPGLIQPHGWLAALDAGTLALLVFSENWSDLAGEAAGSAALPGRIEALLQPLQEQLRERLAALVDGESPASLGHVTLAGKRLHLSAHRQGERVALELEPAAPDHGTQAPIYSLARHLLPQMQRSHGIGPVCRLAAAEMKRLTGFGRSLVYRFDAEGHGAVLAEVLDAGYDSYAHHRFPASDIPAQARALYEQNHIRVIPDARYQPVPLRFADGRPGSALDLSQASLRSVSPVHLEYMRNMGTLASMSVSIIVRGRLWGLVSCHDHAPRELSFETRLACEHLGQLLSLQIEAKEEQEQANEQLKLRELTLAMVAQMADSDATLQRLVGHPGLLRIAGAGGAAVVLDEACWTAGDTPDVPSVQDIAAWLANGIDHERHTDRLPSVAPAFEGLAHVAAGVMAISISRLHRHYIIWFRPEIIQTIDWAGDPRKEVAGTDGRLHPRRSFSTWREEVRGRSLPWSPGEVQAALELRQALIGIVLARAEEMAEVAGELGRVNKELEAFSYTVSHDLRAPMRHIAGFIDLVVESEGALLSERALRYLRHVKDASAHAGQLVDALLDFSRMGRSALKRTTIDTQVLVDDLVAEYASQQRDRTVTWRVDPNLPPLWGDPILLQVAVRNLLSNAVKYTRPRAEARIEVRGLREEHGTGLEVIDNGIGFQMKYVGKLFGVFQRLHQSESFEGTGIGLASMRRIVERHGGEVSAHGEPDRGARFGFIIPTREDFVEPRADTKRRSDDDA
jgi:chemotaxis family two-component system sensor kinase Cph1